jgi:hypothetical protein
MLAHLTAAQKSEMNVNAVNAIILYLGDKALRELGIAKETFAVLM